MSQNEEETAGADLVGLAAEIVSAYIGNNRMQRAELPGLIGEVHAALTRAASGAGQPAAEPAHPKASAGEIRRSITPDHLVSFEDGKRYKTLRRHLSGRGLTPEQYREKWGLPADYPMASPSYSKQRSELARALGLGQQRRKGLVKLAPEEALRVEVFEEETEIAVGEAPEDLPDAPEAEATETKAAPKRGRGRARKVAAEE